MSCKNALLLFYNVIDIRWPKMPNDLPTEGMWAFGIGRRNVNPCCGRFIPNPQLAGTWPLGADANCMINVSFILQSLIGLLCICVAWPPYDVTAGDWGSFTLQQLIAELWFSIGLYPEQFCSGLILGGYGTIGECITLDPDIRLMQTKSSQESIQMCRMFTLTITIKEWKWWTTWLNSPCLFQDSFYKDLNILHMPIGQIIVHEWLFDQSTYHRWDMENLFFSFNDGEFT